MEISKHLKSTKGMGRNIHEYIDRYYGSLGPDHRIVFHHLRGVENIVMKFGEAARPIAIQHIKDDIYGSMFDGEVPKDHTYYKPFDNKKYDEALKIAGFL